MTELFEAPADELDAFEAPEDELDSNAAFEAPDDELDVADTGQSRVSSGLSAAGRGFGSAITDAVSGLGQLSQFAVRNLNPVGLAAQAGFKPAQQAVDLYSKPGKFVEELGQSGTEAVAEALPVNPAPEKEWLASTIPGAVGQMAGMAVPALLTGGASLAPTAVRLATWLPRIQGGLLGLNSGYAEADRQGITDQAQRDAMALSFGAAEAGTEMLGGLGTAEFTKRLLGHAVAKGGQEGAEGFLKRFIKTTATEGLEEPAAGELQDIAANIFGGGEGEAPPSLSLTDPAMWQRRGEEAALGSIAASPLALADAALEARRGKANPATLSSEALAKEEPFSSAGGTEAPGNEGATDAEFAALHRATASAEAAGMTQTAQALRDLAAKAQAQKVAPVAAAPVEEAPAPVEAPPVPAPEVVAEEVQSVADPFVEAPENAPQGTNATSTTNHIIQDESGQVRQESVSGVPEQSSPESPILPPVQSVIDEGLAENAPIDPGAAPTGERPELRTRLPGQGEDSEETLRGVRSGDSGNAPQQLPEATGGDVDVPPVPLGAPSGPVGEVVKPAIAEPSPADDQLSALEKEPSTAKFRDFDSGGYLSREAELPQQEAVKKLTVRKNIMEMLKRCLEGKSMK